MGLFNFNNQNKTTIVCNIRFKLPFSSFPVQECTTCFLFLHMFFEVFPDEKNNRRLIQITVIGKMWSKFLFDDCGRSLRHQLSPADWLPDDCSIPTPF